MNLHLAASNTLKVCSLFSQACQRNCMDYCDMCPEEPETPTTGAPTTGAPTAGPTTGAPTAAPSTASPPGLYWLH